MIGDENTCSYCGDQIREPERGSFGYYCGFYCLQRDEQRIRWGITMLLAILLILTLATLHYLGVIQLL